MPRFITKKEARNELRASFLLLPSWSSVSINKVKQLAEYMNAAEELRPLARKLAHAIKTFEKSKHTEEDVIAYEDALIKVDELLLD